MLIIISIVSFFISWLSFLSGFGLSTVLMPVLTLFFPVPLSISATALIHFLNNIFKFFLMKGAIVWRVFILFSIGSLPFALFGALLLNYLGQLEETVSYNIGTLSFEVTILKFIIGIIVICFALMEFLLNLKKFVFPVKLLPIGGMLSGFFGGLSGNQGALRSIFLIKLSINKNQYVATSIAISLVIDASRLITYQMTFVEKQLRDEPNAILPIICAVCFAFLGALIGRLTLKKVEMRHVKFLVLCMLVILGTLLITDLV